MIAENLPDQRCLEAIFLEEIERGALQVDSTLTASAATSIAEYSLMTAPERPIALVCNAHTTDPDAIDDERGAVRRILGRVAHSGWHVAWAYPNVDAWILADPRVRGIFDGDEVTRRSRYDRAVRIGPLARTQAIDRDAIGRAFPDFRALVAFIERHAFVPQPTS